MKNTATRSLPLEAYIDFYSDPWNTSISLAHLKQIVAMHGFQQLYPGAKKHHVECLASVEMMPPWRSTLEKGVSSSTSFLMADEVASDLADLGWHECQSQPIVTFDPRFATQADRGCDLAPPAANDGAVPPAALPRRSNKRDQKTRTPPAEFVVSVKRPRSKRKRISINAISRVASAFHPAVAALAASPGATPHEEAAPQLAWSPSHATPSSSSWTMSSTPSSSSGTMSSTPPLRNSSRSRCG